MGSYLFDVMLDPSNDSSDEEESTLFFDRLQPEYRMVRGVTYLFPDIVGRFATTRYLIESPKTVQNAKIFLKISISSYNRGKYNEAMRNIMFSINTCPNNENLDFLIGTRSCYLFFLGDYTSALADANRILINNRCPQNFMLRMSEHKFRCIIMANLTLHYWGFLKQERFKMISDVDTYNNITFLIKLFRRRLKFSSNSADIDYNRRILIPRIFSINPYLLHASSKIQVARSILKKRFIEAADDIETGEILIAEKPLVSMLYLNNTLTHCSHCFVRCTALIPCKGCFLMFCSQACYREAINQYHRFECIFLQCMETNKLQFENYQLITLKFFLIATRNGTLLRNLMTDPIYKHPYSPKAYRFDTVYLPNDYFNIHNFEDNYDKLSSEQWFHYSADAATILYWMKKLNFFDPFQSDRNRFALSSLERFAGSLLLKFMLSVEMNAHDVDENVCLPSNITYRYSVGCAIYPTFRFVSHSCNHNTSRIFHRNWIVVRAYRPISIGEEIFDNYGYYYWSSPTAHRRSNLLADYHFQCNCISCLRRWPLMNDLPSNFALIPTLINRQNINLEQIQLWYQDFLSAKYAYSDQALSFLYMYLTLLHNTFQQPFKQYVLAEFAIQLLSTYRGNYYNHVVDTLFKYDTYYNI